MTDRWTTTTYSVREHEFMLAKYHNTYALLHLITNLNKLSANCIQLQRNITNTEHLITDKIQ